MKDFKFSIVIYKCIRSIVRQTLNFEENIEIILINDGSTDNTGNICKIFAEEYPRNIKYISKKHEGRGNSKNLGISEASGKYIYFIDGDNFISKNALRNVLDFFNEN